MVSYGGVLDFVGQKVDDAMHPDYVPSVFPHKEQTDDRKALRLRRHTRLSNRMASKGDSCQMLIVCYLDLMLQMYSKRFLRGRSYLNSLS
jgi:hypothetical protein